MYRQTFGLTGNFSLCFRESCLLGVHGLSFLNFGEWASHIFFVNLYLDAMTLLLHSHFVICLFHSPSHPLFFNSTLLLCESVTGSVSSQRLN